MAASKEKKGKGFNSPAVIWKDMKRDRWLYFLLLPGIIFFIIFKYMPIFGLRIAFMDYNQYAPESSTWVGLKHFTRLFTTNSFVPVLINTIKIAGLKLLIGFPFPIILALMLNEVTNLKFKKAAQTFLYLPHFVSWVIMAGIVMNLLDPTTGAITQMISKLTGNSVNVLTDTKLFVPMLIISDVYKEVGWGTIIYFAAISGIDPQLYEAAAIDGAGKWKQCLNITLPSIKPTIIIMLIMNTGNILNAGFNQIFMLYTPTVYKVADIIDTYVFRMGIVKADYSFSTAAGMFKSIVAFILVCTVNEIAKKTDNDSIW